MSGPLQQCRFVPGREIKRVFCLDVFDTVGVKDTHQALDTQSETSPARTCNGVSAVALDHSIPAVVTSHKILPQDPFYDAVRHFLRESPSPEWVREL